MIRLFKKKPLSYSEYLIEQGLWLQQKIIEVREHYNNSRLMSEYIYKQIEITTLNYYLDYLELVGSIKLAEFIKEEVKRDWEYVIASGKFEEDFTQDLLIEMIIKKFNRI